MSRLTSVPTHTHTKWLPQNLSTASSSSARRGGGRQEPLPPPSWVNWLDLVQIIFSTDWHQPTFPTSPLPAFSNTPDSRYLLYFWTSIHCLIFSSFPWSWLLWSVFPFCWTQINFSYPLRHSFIPTLYSKTLLVSPIVPLCVFQECPIPLLNTWCIPLVLWENFLFVGCANLLCIKSGVIADHFLNFQRNPLWHFIDKWVGGWMGQ